MKLVRWLLAPVLVCALLLFSRPAPAVPSLPTTTTVVALAATVVVIVVFVMQKGDGGVGNLKVEAEQARAAELALAWLRQTGPGLEQSLAFGEGPELNDLAQALSIEPAHRAEFRELLKRHRAELLELSRNDRLSLDRAARFFKVVGDLVHEDSLLSSDYERMVSLATAI